MLTLDRFAQWMDRYAQASEARDAHGAAALFAPQAEYRETPFAAPLVGQDAIYRYWHEAAQQFRDVDFAYEILAVCGNQGIALWRSQFTSATSDVQAMLDGVFVVEFDDQGRCCRFREWWHREAMEPGMQAGAV
jgi:hypothetical protein